MKNKAAARRQQFAVRGTRSDHTNCFRYWRAAACTATSAVALLATATIGPSTASASARVSTATSAAGVTGPLGKVSLVYSTQVSDADHCEGTFTDLHQSCIFVEPWADLGGPQSWNSTFTGTVNATVPIRTNDNLGSSGTGSGAATESGASFDQTGTFANMHSDAGLASICNYTGSQTAGYMRSLPGTFTVPGLRAIRNARGAITDFEMLMQRGLGFPTELVAVKGTVTKISPSNDPDLCGSLGEYTAEDGTNRAANDISSVNTSKLPLDPTANYWLIRGWRINPDGNWDPQTGGVLAEKTVDGSAAFAAPATGRITVRQTLRIVTEAVNSVTLAAMSPVDLLQADRLVATVHPGRGAVSSYTFQWRRVGTAAWTRLSSGKTNSYILKPRVAGKVQLRVVAETSAGKTLYSPPVDVEVRFPSYDEIFTNQTVKKMADQAWQQTLQTTTRAARGERCFFIKLNTASGRYIQTPTKVTVVGPTERGGCNKLGNRPADRPEHPTLTDRPTYVVAWFHTHTPTLYVNFCRRVGPSPADHGVSRTRQVPGAAYDYDGVVGPNAACPMPANQHYIPAHWPLRNPAELWPVEPPVRRATP